MIRKSPRPSVLRRTLCMGCAALILSASALAQSQAPIRILVGAAPGGSTDTLAREIAPQMARLLDRNVVIENRAGAGGNLAAEAVAKAAPDGNTLLVSFTSHTINATLFPKLPFDPIADFTPLTMIATTPSILVANPSVPVSNIKELIAYAKKQPGKLNFAIGGIGSSLHLAGEAFKMQAGVFIVNIPYRSTSPAIVDVVAGTVPLMFAPVAGTRQLIATGKLKALGVTSPKRLAQFPDVPAISETLSGFESSAWFGLFGPAGMKPELVKTISDAARAAVHSDSMQSRVESDGGSVIGNSPAEFAAFVKADVPRWEKLVKYSGATVD